MLYIIKKINLINEEKLDWNLFDLIKVTLDFRNGFI